MSENDQSRKDIRRILKTFGIRADEAMVAHLARNPYVQELRVRIVLEDLTEYESSEAHGELQVIIEDSIKR